MPGDRIVRHLDRDEGRVGKRFFYEQKKQKTSLLTAVTRPHPPAQLIKVFGAGIDKRVFVSRFADVL
jgi:hypothetical protein